MLLLTPLLFSVVFSERLDALDAGGCHHGRRDGSGSVSQPIQELLLRQITNHNAARLTQSPPVSCFNPEVRPIPDSLPPNVRMHLQGVQRDCIKCKCTYYRKGEGRYKRSNFCYRLNKYICVFQLDGNLDN